MPEPMHRATAPQTHRHTIVTATCLFAIAAGLPGADYEGSLSPPWQLLTEPLGATWLALMSLFLCVALLLIHAPRWRGALSLVGGITITMIVGEAMARVANNGTIDTAAGLNATLAGPWVGRTLVLMLLLIALAAPFWAADRTESKQRWTAMGLAAVAIVLIASIGHLGFGEALPKAPGAGVLGAMGAANPVGDRIAAVVVLVGALSVLGTLAVHLALNVRSLQLGGAWLSWLSLVAGPLLVVAAFSATSEHYMFALEAVKYALVLATGLLIGATGLAAVAAVGPPTSAPRSKRT